jgi:hypothetical protein
MEVGFTDAIKQALLAKIEELGGGRGIHVNLALDEVAIKPDESYMKNVDKLVGHVDMAGIVEPVNGAKLANKMLTFAINGLANSFCIVVGYFLVNKMTAEELSKLTLHILEEVEKIGFTVVGAVADNASTNTKMFKLINSEGVLSHEISHPNDPTRKLYISFDSSHIIKNVRNKFIDRPLKRKGKPILFAFIKRIHEKQKKVIMKLVKKLTTSKRLKNKALFTSTSNEMLQLLKDFLKWLKDWKNLVALKDNLLTSETYEAITITTKSTIAKIKFLLDAAGFQFVLTRKFNSDNLERKFSALRQANGGNYNMDAKAAIYGMEKLLRTEITYSAINCNVPLSRKKQKRGNENFLRVTGVKVPKKRALDVLKSLNAEELAVLDELKRPPGTLLF